MSFCADQRQALAAAKLTGKMARERLKDGPTLSYIEGWFAISEANRIFGFEGWDRETVTMRASGRVSGTVGTTAARSATDFTTLRRVVWATVRLSRRWRSAPPADRRGVWAPDRAEPPLARRSRLGPCCSAPRSPPPTASSR